MNIIEAIEHARKTGDWIRPKEWKDMRIAVEVQDFDLYIVPASRPRPAILSPFHITAEWEAVKADEVLSEYGSLCGAAVKEYKSEVLSTAEKIDAWHKAARPAPAERELQALIGCHLEEVAEFIDSLLPDCQKTKAAVAAARATLHILAEGLKSGSMRVGFVDRRDAMDALCDQIVTAIGIGHCAGFPIIDTLRGASRSN